MTNTPVHLLSRWARVSRRLRAAKRLALFLDFDGTLHPLRRRPEAVALDRSTRRVLARLSRRRRVTLCVISGRRRDDLKKRVGVPGLVYLGLHGWERGSGVRASARLRAAVKRVRQSLERRLRNLRGIWVEDKTLSFVVHYRAARATIARRARSIVRGAVRPHRSELRVLAGKKVWEVLPREVPGKGAAAKAFLARGFDSALPIYIGDDTSDEEAFAALGRGLTIRVGRSRRTQARFTLRNPLEVRSFLQRLESEIA